MDCYSMFPEVSPSKPWSISSGWCCDRLLLPQGAERSAQWPRLELPVTMLREILWFLRGCTAHTMSLHPQLDSTVRRYMSAVEELQRKVISMHQRLGWEANHFSASLHLIKPWDRRHHTHKHHVLETATLALWPLLSSPRHGATHDWLSDGHLGTAIWCLSSYPSTSEDGEWQDECLL